MIQLGARNGVAEARNVFQSDLLLGEKSLVPAGQLFFCVVLRTSRHCWHLKSTPAEYRPSRDTLLQLHELGLPFFGTKETSFIWQ